LKKGGGGEDTPFVNLKKKKGNLVCSGELYSLLLTRWYPEYTISIPHPSKIPFQQIIPDHTEFPLG
jgi:hypothetical protein